MLAFDLKQARHTLYRYGRLGSGPIVAKVLGRIVETIELEDGRAGVVSDADVGWLAEMGLASLPLGQFKGEIGPAAVGVQG